MLTPQPPPPGPAPLTPICIPPLWIHLLDRPYERNHAIKCQQRTTAIRRPVGRIHWRLDIRFRPLARPLTGGPSLRSDEFIWQLSLWPVGAPTMPGWGVAGRPPWRSGVGGCVPLPIFSPRRALAVIAGAGKAAPPLWVRGPGRLGWALCHPL